jgi:dihydroorotate dehydrogenase
MLVLNVSSPNTPGLRALQAVEVLGELVAAVRGELDELGVRVPLLVKIAPDLSDAEIDAIATAALGLGLDGIVAVNTTIARPPLASGVVAFPGGLSGPPLRPRAVAVLRRLRAITGDRLVLVSVGGVETAQDAWERIRAGATLVQAYTGFVYGGPLWAARINRGLAQRVRAAGAGSVSELVGTEIAGGEAPGERSGGPMAGRCAP